jgi:hypothetical protein
VSRAATLCQAPVADLLFYGLISSPLNERPRVVAFIMGALHGIDAALVLAALRVLDAALQRDPYPPAGMWDVRGYVLYEEAIVAFRNVRGQHFWTLRMLAAAYAQAGQLQDTRDQLKHFLEARPGATLGSIALLPIRLSNDQRLRDHWLDGLCKAGLPE